jgi:hypothetical protein
VSAPVRKATSSGRVSCPWCEATFHAWSPLSPELLAHAEGVHQRTAYEVLVAVTAGHRL